MDIPPSSISILIPDSEDHKPLTLQVVRCLSIEKDITIFLMSSVKQNYLKYSRHVNHISYYKKTNDEEWVSEINNQVEHHNIDIIMPVFDRGIETLIRNKNLVKDKNKLCVSPKLSNYNIARHKDSLYLHLIKHKLPTPKSIITKAGAYESLKELNFPVIAKPVIGFSGGNGIQILNSNEDVKTYCKYVKYNCNSIYQNYIKGYDICCNVICDNGEVIAHTIQCVKSTHNTDLEPQTSFCFTKQPELLELIKKLMVSLDWTGVANIDCRYDENSKEFKIIEVNTRYWINIDASAIANVNFPYLHCLLTLSRKIYTKEYKTIPYLNLKGLVREVFKNPSMIFNYSYLKNNTSLVFVIKDPIPDLCRFVWRTKNVVVKKTKKRQN
ncbi:ATP-grasp domain-containing protein [Winogradskyella sp. PE311]|uniref:ATP-grasp domain-containing protein n=1 Tax=Winogradskyella sp. PE311 TaxID=3366943 RepID=UPI003980FAAD